MIELLNVWLTLPTGAVVKAGELAVKEPDQRGALQGQFRYVQEYLKRADAFSFDPLHLSLSAEIYTAKRPYSGVELARRAGLETAITRQLTVGGRKCLLVKRFDINLAGWAQPPDKPAVAAGGRRLLQFRLPGFGGGDQTSGR